MRTAAAVAVVLLLAAIVAEDGTTGGGQPSCPPGENIVSTDAGCLRGRQLGSVKAFLGVPYAASPVGERRWRPPQPPEPWEGVRDAAAFGPACPQIRPIFDQPIPEWDEDCLTLNVWTPTLDPEAKLPVMVWIHGGGLISGSGSQPLYDGQFLASQGEVIVVTINYRLAQLGFLAHPLLSAESEHDVSGNYGLLDQIFALRWVRRNIKSFGGDPGNVTIFGESAGASSVCALLVSPLAEGLFHKAIFQSGVCPNTRPLRGSGPQGEESAEAQGERFARALGCAEAPDVLACMRSKPPREILETLPANGGLFHRGEDYRPTVDGYVLREEPWEAIAAGRHRNVPLIAGTTADEASLFTDVLGIRTRAQFEALVRRIFGEAADRVLQLYPASAYPRVKDALDALVTDWVFVCPTRRLVRAVSREQPHVYLYQFTHVPPIGRLLRIGAYHGAELEFLFGTLRVLRRIPPYPQELALSEAMMAYWTSFAWTGDPNARGEEGDRPRWPRYTQSEDPHLELDIPIVQGHGLRKRYCDFFDEVLDQR